jgi:hypothetical protein
MTPPAPSVHDLLLALAGRLDDDLLAWARELVAVGEEGQAVELAATALAAEEVALPPAVRAAIVAAARAAHTDLDAARALAPAAADDGTAHRFDPQAGDADAVVAVLTGLPARRLAGCRVHLTWRRTPAGAAPGPVPHPVLLVESDPDRSADVLAYQLAAELDRAGIAASVEVFPTGTTLPAYQAAALRAAREVPVGGRTDGAGRPAAGPPESTTTSLFAVPPGADGGSAPGRRRRPEAAEQDAERAPVADPLSGPLPVPLLAPLLDRPSEPAAVDPAGQWQHDWRSGQWAMPSGGRQQLERAQDADPRDGGLGPGRAAAAHPSGEVSLFESPTARVAPGADHPLFGAEAPAPTVRRHRPEPEEASGERAADGADPEPKPESLALLNGAERDLLAQLKAELAARERRPRPFPRPGANGHAVNGHRVNGHGVEGHGPDDGPTPPDRAG